MDVKKLHSRAFEQYKAKNYKAALKNIAKLKKIAPNYKDAYHLEIFTWHELDNPVKEISLLEKILSMLDSSSPQEKDLVSKMIINIGSDCNDLNMIEEALSFYRLAIQFVVNKRMALAAIDNSLMAANHAENFSAVDFQALYDEHKKYLADIVPYPKKFYSHEKIRVGFLSSDFRHHVVMNWSWSLLTKLDKNLFETYCYSSVKNSDEVTAYLRKLADGWREISTLSDEQAAKLIRDDEIDILFDFSGHTESNRLPIAAYRPATLQVSGIGYMNSTGLECFDYFLSDVYCAGDEKFFTEKVIHLPHSHICYEPSIRFEPAATPPCLKNNFVTFGSFNRFGKITDSMLTAWKKILDAVPNSRLILKSKIFNTDDGRNFASERLKNFGLDLSRVELRPYTLNHFAEYADVDIALDTFPYTGGVTTCEALYMGVPVVSLYGARHGSRFGLSILKNVGLDELAVDSYEEYINRAVALAGDWELLNILRKNLRTMMEKSPLMNSELYIRDVEQAFIKILNDERNQKTPPAD